MSIDLERLSEIRSVVDTPLVLHGTSGVPDETVCKCIRCGIRKVNYVTDFWIAFTKAVCQALQTHPETINPPKNGAAGREAVKQYVMGKIQMCGNAGRG